MSDILLVILLVALCCLAGFVIFLTVRDYRANKQLKDQARKSLEDIFGQFGVELDEKKDNSSFDFSDLNVVFDNNNIGSDSQSISEHKSE